MRTLSLLLLTTTFAAAQDMPLHEILRRGEDWKSATERPSIPATSYTVDAAKKVVRHKDREFPVPVPEPTCCAVALGGSTLLVGDAAGRYVWAFRIEKDGSIGPGDRYCRLRVNESNRSETSALTVDGVGRFYAATNIGIQVFDPTGRLCGVITAPPGKIAELFFNGDELCAMTGDKAFIRRLQATGKK
jgi:hypothetical protein